MEPRDDKTELNPKALSDGADFEGLFHANDPSLREIADETSDSGSKTLSDLSVCPHCDCEMVYPVDWARAESHRWQVTLRCPNCTEITSGVFEEDLIERFDCLLDRGTDSLVRDLRNLTYANMATEISAFVDALQADYVLPEDF